MQSYWLSFIVFVDYIVPSYQTFLPSDFNGTSHSSCFVDYRDVSRCVNNFPYCKDGFLGVWVEIPKSHRLFDKSWLLLPLSNGHVELITNSQRFGETKVWLNLSVYTMQLLPDKASTHFSMDLHGSLRAHSGS